MNISRRLTIIVLMFVLLATLPASAQDSEPSVTIEPAAASGNLDIQHDLQTQATVEVIIGDQVYRVTVPVAVKIDASVPLTSAQVSGPASEQVGTFFVEPVGVQRIQGAYEKDYRTVSPASPDNVVVVFTTSVTNLSNETLDPAYSSVLTVSAVDDAGNSYDEEARICDSIDPNETVTCQFIFDAPATATLVDLRVEAMARKQFSFAGLGAAD